MHPLINNVEKAQFKEQHIPILFYTSKKVISEMQTKNGNNGRSLKIH